MSSIFLGFVEVGAGLGFLIGFSVVAYYGARLLSERLYHRSSLDFLCEDSNKLARLPQESYQYKNPHWEISCPYCKKWHTAKNLS